jgi:hypothetical protein
VTGERLFGFPVIEVQMGDESLPGQSDGLVVGDFRVVSRVVVTRELAEYAVEHADELRELMARGFDEKARGLLSGGE